MKLVMKIENKIIYFVLFCILIRVEISINYISSWYHLIQFLSDAKSECDIFNPLEWSWINQTFRSGWHVTPGFYKLQFVQQHVIPESKDYV